jgi:hypothetical protein
MSAMATEVRRLDVKVGDLVEIEGRRYDPRLGQGGGVALEPAVTKTVEQLHADAGAGPLSREEFEELFGDLPRDGEG